MTGTLIAIARRPARRATMEEIERGAITAERGLEGDHKGAKFPNRRITILAVEAWRQTLDDLGAGIQPVELHWTTRRANLLVEGVSLPRAAGGIISCGDVRLEITAQTVPCGRMEEACPGLLKAMRPDWRGGVTCRVLAGGSVRINDRVDVLFSPPERRNKLPG